MYESVSTARRVSLSSFCVEMSRHPGCDTRSYGRLVGQCQAWQRLDCQYAAEWGRLLHSLRTTKCWQFCRSVLLYNPRQAAGYVLLRPRWCAQHRYVCWLGHVQSQLSVVSEVVLAGS